MRKVFLDDLPKKYGIGANKDKLVVDWSNCVGLNVRFIYDDIDDYVEIIGYDNKSYKVLIRYKDVEINIATNHFSNCEIGRLLMIRTSEYRYDIGSCIADSSRNLKIIERYKDFKSRAYKSGEYRKMYKCKCMNCGFDDITIDEINITHGRGCPVCANKLVIKGINDIATTHKDLIKYFVNIEDAYKYSYGTQKKVLMKCQDCGETKLYAINKLQKGYLPCICSDNISYPNKFIYSILKQLNIKHEHEKSFCWSNRKIYDIYIDSIGCIIENHGEQHYKHTGFRRQLEIEQANDKLKYEMALNNDIKHYVVLDCRESNVDWMKKSIMSSELPMLLNFKENDVDWLECENYARKNLIKEICHQWDSNSKITEFSKLMGYDRNVIRGWLAIGNKNGWCEYDSEKEKEKRRISSSIANKKRCCKKVKIFKEGVCLGEFESATDIDRISESLFGTKLIKSMISSVCNGKRNQYKGYVFSFSDKNN